MQTQALTKRLAGKIVARVTGAARGPMRIHFDDGSSLRVEKHPEGLSATFREPHRSSRSAAAGPLPTHRQREYLDFIRRYALRFGVPPAESDIQRHFLVSAPSVNSMIQGLERRGFVTRERDEHGRTVPRSIRVVFDDE